MRNTALIRDHGLGPIPALPLDSMEEFSIALWHYSQGLRSLRVLPFKLDDIFIPGNCSTTCQCPNLQHLDLQFFEQAPYVGQPEQAMAPEPYKQLEGFKSQQDDGPDGEGKPYVESSTAERLEICPPEDRGNESEEYDGAREAADILWAAGESFRFSSALESVRISVWSQKAGDPVLYIKRKLCPKSGTTISSRVWLSGVFSPEDREEIMDAWGYFLWPRTEDEGLQSEFPELPRASRSTG